MKKAISVFSGGLDCTVATCVFDEEYEIHVITFDYGQKAVKEEIDASKRICEKMGWMHEVIDLPWLSKISTSSLNTDADIPELGEDDLDDLDKSSETASNVWVPARNTVFTSIALSYAESIDAEIIIVGWNSEEGATFPDNTKEYLEKFNELIETIFKETGSLGIRIAQNMHRGVAKREFKKETFEINGKNYEATFKIGYVNGEMISRRPEYEDLKRIANETGLPLIKIKEMIK